MLKARPYSERNTQAWYFDAWTKTIKSVAHKDQSLGIRDGGESANLQVEATNARWFQLFSVEGDFIVNERGKILEVADGIDKEGSNIKVGEKNGGPGQRWEVAYLDELAPDPKKGELSREWGFYVERPFYVVSELDSHRYLDIVGDNLVIKTPNGFDTQKWTFDWQSRTIKSVHNMSTSFDIAS